ncbi:MarR family winged helix-turn-helix transcriptional regulator [Geodermatophilus sp. SYSU D00691]
MASREDLARVDRALLSLRRAWDAPAGVRHEGRTVEGSTLLVCLALAEHGSGRAGVLEVADFLGVTHSTASRLVSRAVDAGMVARDRSPSDPRRAALSLTDGGRRLVLASDEFRTARLGTLLADWTAGDVAALADLLSRFATAMTASPPSDAAGRP